MAHLIIIYIFYWSLTILSDSSTYSFASNLPPSLIFLLRIFTVLSVHCSIRLNMSFIFDVEKVGLREFLKQPQNWCQYYCNWEERLLYLSEKLSSSHKADLCRNFCWKIRFSEVVKSYWTLLEVLGELLDVAGAKYFLTIAFFEAFSQPKNIGASYSILRHSLLFLSDAVCL